MTLIAASRRSVRPSHSSPVCFALWAILCTGAAGALCLFPDMSWFWVMLMSLGSLAGSPPAEPDRARSKLFVGFIIAAAVFVIAFGVAVFLPRAGAPASAVGAVPTWFRVVLGVAWAIFLGVEAHHFRALRRHAAA